MRWTVLAALMLGCGPEPVAPPDREVDPVVTTTPPAQIPPEDCANAIDDDGDAFTDCYDSDCASTCDVDGDGVVAEALGGADCDDSDAAIGPDATETCNDLDDDCDGAVDDEDDSLDLTSAAAWYPDADGDLAGAGDPVTSCDMPAGYAPDASDCDDTRAEVSPFGLEVCGGLDEDCDGLVDDADDSVDVALADWSYEDADGDGFGDPASAVQACAQPAGFVTDDTDCAPADPAVFTDLPWWPDGDLDGAGDPDGVIVWSCTQPAGYSSIGDDCDDTDAALDPRNVWYADVDGDGYGDDGWWVVQCYQPEGYLALGGDCDDDDAAVNPGVTWYGDADEDGFGDSADPMVGCDLSRPSATNDADCDDDRYDVYPGAPELCEGDDNDCDGAADEVVDYVDWYADVDGDGYGNAQATTLDCVAPPGFVGNDDDCDDLDPTLAAGDADLDGECDVDDWCDGVDSSLDADEDGTPACADCDDGDPDRGVGLPEVYFDSTDLNCVLGYEWGAGDGRLGEAGIASQPVPIETPTLEAAVAVAAGGYHTLVVDADGLVRAWGDNSQGQVGDGTLVLPSVPVTVAGPSDVVLVSAGSYHSLAVDGSGLLWAWGRNDHGQLGDGTYVQRKSPVAIALPFTATAIAGAGNNLAGGEGHTLAIDDVGAVWTWGTNTHGQLGDGTKVDRPAPVQVLGLPTIVQVAGGGYHSIALAEDGTVWTWGDNGYGQLGTGTWNDSSSPVQVTSIQDAVAVSAGTLHSVVLLADGSVLEWGSRWFYDPYGSMSANAPIAIAIDDVVDVKAGYYYNIALLEDGTVWTWGNDAWGVLGAASTGSSGFVPVQVVGLEGIHAVAAQFDAAFALGAR